MAAVLTLSNRTWLFTFSFIFPLDHFCSSRRAQVLYSRPLLLWQRQSHHGKKPSQAWQLLMPQQTASIQHAQVRRCPWHRATDSTPSSFPCCCLMQPVPWPPLRPGPWVPAGMDHQAAISVPFQGPEKTGGPVVGTAHHPGWFCAAPPALRDKPSKKWTDFRLPLRLVSSRRWRSSSPFS